MSEANKAAPASERADASEGELSQDDLESVAGGGEISDAINILQDCWSDIKQGIVDAWND